jgi:hypothetical protein
MKLLTPRLIILVIKISVNEHLLSLQQKSSDFFFPTSKQALKNKRNEFWIKKNFLKNQID